MDLDLSKIGLLTVLQKCFNWAQPTFSKSVEGEATARLILGSKPTNACMQVQVYGWNSSAAMLPRQ